MLTKTSYNVVIERFKAFADGHYLIRRFSHGQVDVTDIVQDNQYPWMHIVPVSMTPSDGAISYEFDVIFADLPRDKETPTEYQRESLSDCIRLAEDLISEIKNGGVIFGTEVTLETGTTIEPFIEEYTHTLTGVNCKLSMQFPNDWSACEIPADWSAGGSGSGGSGGGGGTSIVLRTNGTDNAIQTILDLTEGTNITITDLGDGRVRFDATGDIGATWGSIGGLLSNQTDLQEALDLKVDITSLAAVATSGDYNDLTNLPTIPTATSELTNDSGFITIGDVPPQVNADWNATSGVEEILNKPTIPTELNDLTDVNVSSPNDGDALIYFSSGSEFKNQPLAPVATSNDYNDLDNLPTLPPVIGDMLKSVYDTDVDGVVDAAETIQIVVRNSTGVTLTKGQVVYLSGATGNRPNAVLADASTEATSSKTIGFVIEDIADNADGQVAVEGTLHNLDTSAFTAGDTIWLSETAGAWQANTPPAEPAHAVFLGYIARSHPTLGRVILHVQNGYELNELHGVDVPSPSSNDYLYYDGATSLWKSRQLTASHITDSNDVGQNLVKLANPNAISYLRVNADNSVNAISLATLKSELGLSAVAIKSTNQSSNVTSYADVNDLNFAVVSGKKYRFKIVALYDATNTSTGSRWSINSAVTFSQLLYYVEWSLTSAGASTRKGYTTFDEETTANATSAFTTGNVAVIEGIIFPTSSGTITARFACELTITSITCKAGSYIEFEEVA